MPSKHMCGEDRIDLMYSRLGLFLFEYEMDRLPPTERIAWQDLEQWQRDAWIEEAKDYWHEEPEDGDPQSR